MKSRNEEQNLESTWPTLNDQSKERRNPTRPDRRNIPRGGRRAADLPHPIMCPSCGQVQDVKGMANSRVVRWCHCTSCGEVWPWSVEL